MAQSIQEVQVNVLSVGLDPVARDFVHTVLGDVKWKELNDADTFTAFLEAGNDTAYHFAVCGPSIEGLAPSELAQAIRMLMQGIPAYYFTTKREGYDRKTFTKNGFNDAFLVPFDSEVAKQAMLDIKMRAANMKMKPLKQVKLIDMQADSKLDFELNIFLPTNKKYIKYIEAGDSLDPAQLEKLKSHKVNNLYVPQDQMQKFFDYTASRLVDLSSPGGGKGISETERKERLQTAVRDLVTSIFNTDANEATIEAGKMLISDVQKIVSGFVLAKSGDWYSKLSSSVGDQADVYSHSSAVSAYAALFSMGLEMGRPEDLATAGLLHDLGLADLPPAVQTKEPHEMTADELSLYKTHPDLTIKIIKERKLIVPPTVMTAISQHHELFNGTGFPKGLAGPRICVEAQILGMADRFDYLTRESAGKKKLSPLAALEKMLNEGTYNPELISKLKKLLPAENTQVA